MLSKYLCAALVLILFASKAYAAGTNDFSVKMKIVGKQVSSYEFYEIKLDGNKCTMNLQDYSEKKQNRDLNIEKCRKIYSDFLEIISGKKREAEAITTQSSFGVFTIDNGSFHSSGDSASLDIAVYCDRHDKCAPPEKTLLRDLAQRILNLANSK